MMVYYVIDRLRQLSLRRYRLIVNVGIGCQLITGDAAMQMPGQPVGYGYTVRRQVNGELFTPLRPAIVHITMR